MKTLDEKIKYLMKLTNDFIYIEKEFYKIKDPYQNDFVIELYPVSQGIEKSIDLACQRFTETINSFFQEEMLKYN